jgi:hypothetical protein
MMQFNLLKIIFYTLILVEIIASDAVLKSNESGILEVEPASSLNTREQSEERDERIYSVNDKTLEDLRNIEPNNPQSIPISDFVESPLPQAFDSQNLEEIGNDDFLSRMNTERIVDHMIGQNRSHSFGNFLQSFILCDIPIPFSTSNNRWGGPTLLELISAFLCLCISSFIIFLIIINICDRCLATYSQV